jgi:hypothetical protein
MTNPLTYCAAGHLWDRRWGQRGYQCAVEEHEHALDLIDEIAELLPQRGTNGVRDRLWLLKEILTD